MDLNCTGFRQRKAEIKKSAFTEHAACYQTDKIRGSGVSMRENEMKITHFCVKGKYLSLLTSTGSSVTHLSKLQAV